MLIADAYDPKGNKVLIMYEQDDVPGVFIETIDNEVFKFEDITEATDRFAKLLEHYTWKCNANLQT